MRFHVFAVNHAIKVHDCEGLPDTVEDLPQFKLYTLQNWLILSRKPTFAFVCLLLHCLRANEVD